MLEIDTTEINNQLEEAWEEQDLPRFNSLLEINKRYQDGDEGIDEFNARQRGKEVKMQLEKAKEVLRRMKAREDTALMPYRLHKITKFLNTQST